MSEWRAVPAFPDYAVSDDGHVMRVGRGPGARPGKMLLASVSSNGYPVVSIHRKHLSVHRLMMAAFVGESDQLVRHLDDVKTHNVLSNLVYGDMRENAMDVVNRGAHHFASRTHCSRGHLYTPESTGFTTRPNGRQSRVCLICQVLRRRARGIRPLVIPTHCPYGHAYTDENTGRNNGRRYCRTCNRLRQKARSLGMSYPQYMDALGEPAEPIVCTFCGCASGHYNDCVVAGL